MNISPRTQRPKLVTGDREAIERFAAFCQMLVSFKTKFDDKTIGPKAVEAKKAAKELLEAVKVEMMPKDKRPKPQPLLDDAEAESSPDEAADDEGGDAAPKSPGEGDVEEPNL